MPLLLDELDARPVGPVRRWLRRNPVAMDWVVAAFFAVPAFAGASTHWPAAPPLLLALAGTGALLARRRAPVLVTGALTVLGLASVALYGGLNGFDVGLALALYAVATERPPRDAWVEVVVPTVLLSGATLLWAPEHTHAVEITGLGVVVLVGVATGVGVRNRRLHGRAIVERGHALARETEQRAQLATAEERARIAREMHDVVAHSLSVMIALADGAAAAVPRSPASAQAAIAQVSETGRAALTDMRRVLGVLRDDDASYGPPPGGTDLAALVEGYRRAGLPVHLTVSGTALPKDTGLQLAVYRIVQEALTNALRHTRGSGHVEARVSRTDGTVEIEVTDDGGVAQPGGPPPTPGSGRGIIGMRERAAIYGGTVEAGPSGAGWRVRTALHWDEEGT
ncbi:sensor histidine kinase [Cellulomonas cellasea]|uniref:histidine kinase n=2 Tax=Cellulomonas cellasea TaxID=43670 RepID=A0A0A0B5Q1_9CELL|nr:histidine kinase [Cellulomonas cellasea]KGM01503.1 hypothetical protein Q760_00800 [Cellulomonas cellasea DSM 20118]GEA89646.1 two-component sensor histidine kinase [Cellulomonas cellasea]